MGDPAKCKDVIYTGDSHNPWGLDAEYSYVTRAWRATAQLIFTKPAFQEDTCCALFDISSPWTGEQGGVLHSVWDQLPATTLVMSAFT